MAELVEFGLGSGRSVYVEVGEAEPDGMERVGRRERTLQAVKSSFEDALGGVRDAAESAIEQFQGMPSRPAEVEITFGVKFDARAGAVIAETGVEGNFQVTVRWKRPDPD